MAAGGLILPVASSTCSIEQMMGRTMRTEIEKTVAEIEQVLTLLRRHL
ncbi:MAG: hypothetical protein JWQ22_3391 [Devosia sp.]|nr:hypothetical protein [Devosia sp.]